MIDLALSIEHQRTRQGAWGPYKTAADLARYAVIIAEVKPRTVIETGTWNGESARWFAELVPNVLTIDTHNPASPSGIVVSHDAAGRVVRARGDSAWGGWWDTRGGRPNHVIDPYIVPPVLVSLDSDHSPGHVFSEMMLWAPLVTVGSYLVVEDTIVEAIEDYRGRFGEGPIGAVRRYLAQPFPARFERDHRIEDLFPTTQHPGGWLRRVA